MKDLEGLLDGMFDQALVYHGFTDYMRDYELIVYCTADPRTGIRSHHLRYLFKTCVHATVDTAVPEEVWARSLDDCLVDYQAGVDLDGYVWGVRWQVLYPGARLVADSVRAGHWSRALGLDFHEVTIGTNGHNLTLVFSDLEVTEVDEGYSPFHCRPRRTRLQDPPRIGQRSATGDDNGRQPPSPCPLRSARGAPSADTRTCARND